MPEAVVLASDPRKAWRLLAISLAFVMFGAFIVANGNWRGWIGIAFFGLGIPISVGMLVPGLNNLTIGQAGVTVRTLNRKWTVRWDDVERFYVTRISYTSMIGIRWSPGYTKQPTGRKFAKLISGTEAAIPDTFEIRGQALADLLNERRTAADAGHWSRNRTSD